MAAKEASMSRNAVAKDSGLRRIRESSLGQKIRRPSLVGEAEALRRSRRIAHEREKIVRKMAPIEKVRQAQREKVAPLIDRLINGPGR